MAQVLGFGRRADSLAAVDAEDRSLLIGITVCTNFVAAGSASRRKYTARL